jgi:tetratricopeptide (TPR) repeat protein
MEYTQYELSKLYWSVPCFFQSPKFGFQKSHLCYYVIQKFVGDKIMKTMSKSLKSPKSSSPPVARMPTAKPLPSASELSELREEASSLLQSGLFESAEVLCSLVLSRIPAISIRALSAAGAGHIGATITAERAPFLEIMADSLVSRLQHKRASVLFIYAFDALTGRGWILNQLSMRNDKYHNESAFAPNPVDSKMCVRLVFKLAQCLVELKDIGAAVRALESIPLQLRPIRVTVLLGKLYMESGSKRQAIICYKSVLSVYPSSSEAVQILVDLGVSHSEISATAGWNITSKQPNEESSSDQIQRRPLHSMVADVMPRLARALEDRVRWKIHGRQQTHS